MTTKPESCAQCFENHFITDLLQCLEPVLNKAVLQYLWLHSCYGIPDHEAVGRSAHDSSSTDVKSGQGCCCTSNWFCCCLQAFKAVPAQLLSTRPAHGCSSVLFQHVAAVTWSRSEVTLLPINIRHC